MKILNWAAAVVLFAIAYFGSSHVLSVITTAEREHQQYQSLGVHPVAQGEVIDCADDDEPVCHLPLDEESSLRDDINRAVMLAIYTDQGQDV